MMYESEKSDSSIKHQKFGGPDFSYPRMSWIKLNVLWMMYRCARDGCSQRRSMDRRSTI